MAEKVDLNTIPYDAPLSFPEPSRFWKTWQSHAGTKRTKAVLPAVDLTGKNVIVTGGNNGIGREAALQFAEWGANLVLGCRQPPPHEIKPDAVVEECKEKAKAAGKVIDVEWWEIDMASVASVEAFAKRWNATGKALVWLSSLRIE